MGHLSYAPLGRRWRRAKGFRLNSGRVSVFRLRLRLFGFIGLLSRCLESIRRGIGCGGGDGGGKASSRTTGRRCSKSSSRRGLVFDARHAGAQRECKLRPGGRSNSFYAEAIADCLEFIKRTSVAVDGGFPAER